MTKLEKVIKGLETCLSGSGCQTCPYDDEEAPACYEDTTRDALELLKAQRPRVLTVDEVHKLQSLRDGAVWLEVGTGLFPALPEIAMSTNMFFIAIPPQDYRTYCAWNWYNKTWRCWSARPTEEQRKAVKWDAD